MPNIQKQSLHFSSNSPHMGRLTVTTCQCPWLIHMHMRLMHMFMLHHATRFMIVGPKASAIVLLSLLTFEFLSRYVFTWFSNTPHPLMGAFLILECDTRMQSNQYMQRRALVCWMYQVGKRHGCTMMHKTHIQCIIYRSNFRSPTSDNMDCRAET